MRTVLAIGATAVAVAVTGTTVVVQQAVGGGGQQPADVLPASSVAVVSIDLDPSLRQKKAVYDLSKKLPKSNGKARGEKSVKDDLLEAFLDEADTGLSYDRDVRPWLGDRAGLAAVPDRSDDGFTAVVAVQFTDRDKAAAVLQARVDAASPVSFGFAFRGDYVLIAETKAAADTYAAAQDQLSENDRYRSAVDSLDGDQIATAWADVHGVYEGVPEDVLATSPFFADLTTEPAGSFVVGVHADSRFLEVEGRAVDVGDSLIQLGSTTLGTERGNNLISTFPQDAAAALEVTGLGATLSSAFESLSEEDDEIFGATDFARELGLTLPDDLRTIFGEDLAMGTFGEGGESPPLVARVRTDDAARAVALLRKASTGMERADGRAPFEVVQDGRSEYFIGTDGNAIRAARDGSLGDSDSFELALPDAEEAGFALYVDLQRTAALLGSEGDVDLRQLDAIGMTADGERGHFRIRITVR